MRYIITQSQLHTLIYKYLDGLFDEKNFKKETNPFDEVGKGRRIDMFDKRREKLLTYFWYGPGAYDDGTIHNGIGTLHIHHRIVDLIRRTFSIRESKAIDIVADWVSEKLGVDIDEISVYPNRASPPTY